MERQKILIIDDEENLRKILSRLMELEGFKVYQAHSMAKGMEIITNYPDIEVVVTDVRLPDGNGVQILNKVKTLSPEVEVVVITAFGNIQDGVSCMKAGAFDYLTKDDQNDQMVVTIQRAAEKAAMSGRISELESKLIKKYSFENISGKSLRVKESVALAQRVAQTDTSVLLEGETGTGKELFAQAIHYTGPRRKMPFIALNCSAMPHELLESELFGYNKGAFTGASGEKVGLFEAANGGTLFLDEIGEMDLSLQAKLLRVLESQTFIRVGDTQETHVSVRFIAATNKNLREEIKKGSFREDLFHRLSVFSIKIPPLRERQEDIEILAREFLTQFSKSFRKKVKNIAPEAMSLLQKYDWKGNIRELRNVIERAVILANGDTISSDLLPGEIRLWVPGPTVNSLAEIEKIHILRVLDVCSDNKVEAAKILGIGLATLYRKLEEYQSK